MESLKVTKKFDGGNFHLCKFKMHIMLSKHGLWKFVDGSATIPDDEDEMVVTMKRQPRHLHYFVNISHMHNCTHSILQKCQKSLGNILLCARNQNHWKQVIFSKEVLHHQNAKRGGLVLYTSTW